MALTAAHSRGVARRTLLVVLPRPSDLDDFAADLMGFLGTAPEIFPAWESLPQDYGVRDADLRRAVAGAGRLGSDEPPRVS